MTALPHFFQKIQLEDIEALSSISESIFERLGGIVNKILDERLGQLAVIGDTEYSMLTEAQFQLIKGDFWILADGRSVAGSQYQVLTGNSNVPDYRNLFMRGFTGGSPGAVIGQRILDHTHTVALSDPGGNFMLVNNGVRDKNGSNEKVGAWANGDGGFFGGFALRVIVGDTGTGTESRPRNVPLNVFIKIN